MSEYIMKTPLDDKVTSELKSGDRVKITGKIYTARDAAHKKLIDLLSEGQALPIEIKDQVIYYAGPAPAKPGYVIGPAGPTTSGRMDNLTVPLLEVGLKGVIGKGVRSSTVKEGLMKYKAVYFAAVGGAAALLSQKIKKAKVVAFPELGPEAIFELEVEDFPVVVVNDIYGNDLYTMGVQNYLENER